MEGRTIFAVTWLVILYVCSWMFSLANEFGIHFWDPKYALDRIHENPVNADLYNSTAFGEIAQSYYSKRRYHFMLPHVMGAVVWWNLYFLQLIPRVRHAFNKKLHRILGRVLMVTALLQTSSGVGLAMTTHSNVILIPSIFLALSVYYCLYHAWSNAIKRDIPKHKYWVLRMVGYLQSIAFQRFWIFVLILTHQLGWYGLYPDLGDNPPLNEANQIVRDMFDDSFILSVLSAILGTEWYLAGEQGMLEPSVQNPVAVKNEDLPPTENQPLLKSS